MKTNKSTQHATKSKGSGVAKLPKPIGRPPVGRAIGVAKGFGPRHGENAKEGAEVPGDTVPAMLTPREAVLNRNASELAGRGNIEALNQEGNQLADEGIDLAARGETKVKSKQKVKKLQGGDDYVEGGLPEQAFPGRRMGRMGRLGGIG